MWAASASAHRELHILIQHGCNSRLSGLKKILQTPKDLQRDVLFIYRVTSDPQPVSGL